MSVRLECLSRRYWQASCVFFYTDGGLRSINLAVLPVRPLLHAASDLEQCVAVVDQFVQLIANIVHGEMAGFFLETIGYFGRPALRQFL